MTNEQRKLLQERRDWSGRMDGELDTIIAMLHRAHDEWAGYPPASLVTARGHVESVRDGLREMMVMDGYHVDTGTWEDWDNGSSEEA